MVLRTIDKQSNSFVVYYLYIFSNASYIRRQARTLQQHHLSVFADCGAGLVTRPPSVRALRTVAR